MKQHITTKRVKAEPMTHGEAMKAINPYFTADTLGANKEGYLVEYEDGYRTWKPKEYFEQHSTCCDTFLDRLGIDREEVADRFDKLVKAMEKPLFRVKVGEEQWALLLEQKKAMGEYIRVLNERIKLARK